jgi:hypothetical protein
MINLVLLELRSGNSGVNGFLEVEMEVRPVESLHSDEAVGGFSCHALLGRLAVDGIVNSLDVLANGCVLGLLANCSGSSSAVVTAEISDGEDGLPVSSSVIVRAGSAETEASSSQGTLGPSVLNVGKVPVNNLGGGELVELVADIDQSLDRSNINVVDTGEIKNDSLEDGALIVLDSLDVTGLSVVPGTVTKLAEESRVGTATLGKDGLGKMVEVVRGVGVVEAFGESVDEDTRVRSANNDLGVGTISVVERKETGSQRTLTLIDGTRACSAVADIGLHGSDTHNTKEATAGLEETEDDDSGGHGNRGVDTVLNRAEDGNKNTSEEDDNLNGRDTPELVNDLGRGDDISDGVDDNTSKTRVGDVEEDSGKGVESEQDNNGSDDTSEGSTDTSLGLDGSSGE